MATHADIAERFAEFGRGSTARSTRRSLRTFAAQMWYGANALPADASCTSSGTTLLSIPSAMGARINNNFVALYARKLGRGGSGFAGFFAFRS